MPIRDIVLTVVILGSLPVCLARPYFGVLMWSWLGFMNPHRLTWGFAYDLPFSQLVGIFTLVGLLFTRDRRPVPLVRESILLGAFWLLITVTTIFAMFPDRAWKDFEQVSKMFLMCFVTIMVAQEHKRLRILVLVAVLSIGFFGFKGGLFGLATGGAYMVFGPEGSAIGDNNGLGLGLNMILPLLFFLIPDEPRRWLRWLLWAVFGFSIISVLLTYSRGNFLGLVAVGFLILLKTRWKMLAIPITIAAALVLTAFLPDKWFDRINTITTYEEDWSAMSRLASWQIARDIAAEHPFLGGGFRVFGPEVWARYMPEYTNWHNAHSVYFHVLAEHGYTGLLLFLTLVVSTIVSLRSLRRTLKGRPDGRWMVNMSHGIEVGIFGFLICGAFQNLTYFDLFWFLIGVTIILKRLAAELVAAPSPAASSPEVAAPRPAAPRVPVVWSPIR